MYQDFQVDIKRIRIREKLKKILEKPDIYIRKKVPEHICHVLNQISDLRKSWCIRMI